MQTRLRTDVFACSCRETGNRHFVEAQVQIHDFEATSYEKSRVMTPGEQLLYNNYSVRNSV